MFARLILSRSWGTNVRNFQHLRKYSVIENLNQKQLILRTQKCFNTQPKCAFSVSTRENGIFDFWGGKETPHTESTEKIIQFGDAGTENVEITNSGSSLDGLYSDPTEVIDGITAGSEALGEGISSISSLPDATTLADFGLGGSILPHRLFQDVLEYLHTTMDLDWIPAIALLTIILRTLALPSYIAVRRFSVRSANLQPVVSKLMNKITDAKLKRDKFGMRKSQMEYMTLLQENKINPLRILLFNMPNMVIFTSMFYGLRQMCNAQFPSLLDGGALWFTNLTIADPYFILPVVSALSMSAIIKFGAANAEMGPAGNDASIRTIFMALPILSIPILVFQPSAMFAFWVASNIYSVVLMLLFKQSSVQNFFGIPKLIKHDPQTLKKGQMSLKQMFEDFQKLKADRENAKSLLQKVQKHEETLKKMKNK